MSEWKRVVRPLLPSDEAWRFRGGLAYRLPVERFLLGVLAEGSAFDRGVYLWRVSMPLFVPAEHVVLSYSQRVGGGAAKYGSDATGARDAAIRSAHSLEARCSQAGILAHVLTYAARRRALVRVELQGWPRLVVTGLMQDRPSSP